jgi:hypothetical protein
MARDSLYVLLDCRTLMLACRIPLARTSSNGRIFIISTCNLLYVSLKTLFCTSGPMLITLLS